MIVWWHGIICVLLIYEHLFVCCHEMLSSVNIPLLCCGCEENGLDEDVELLEGYQFYAFWKKASK